MVTTRRSPPSSGLAGTAPSSTSNDEQPLPRVAATSPLVPTSSELLLLALYPITLILGSAFSHFSPSTHAPWTESIYSHAHQSFQPAESAPSYFAQKGNVFNLYFVKVGWFWCTLAMALFVAFGSRGRSSAVTPVSARTHRKPNESADETTRRADWDDRVRRLYQTFARYALCTTAWYLLTQWAFGSPLIDKIFAWTGGKCDVDLFDQSPAGLSGVLDDAEGEGIKRTAARVTTSAACKLIGGTWKGGYDISGHVFLLILGSGMLWLEMLPFLQRAWNDLNGGRPVCFENGMGKMQASTVLTLHRLLNGQPEVDKKHDDAHTAPPSVPLVPAVSEAMTRGIRYYATSVALGIAMLSGWMLLMTAAFFHTWSEKAVGCSLAMGWLWVVYFAPRGFPTLRTIVGMPGL